MNIKPGDVVFCEVTSFAEKENRPFIVLEVTDKLIKGLRITHTMTKNKVISIRLGFFDCCANITGYIYMPVDTIDINQCLVSHCSQCEISVLLKAVLKYHNINV